MEKKVLFVKVMDDVVEVIDDLPEQMLAPVGIIVSNGNGEKKLKLAFRSLDVRETEGLVNLVRDYVRVILGDYSSRVYVRPAGELEEEEYFFRVEVIPPKEEETKSS